MYIAFVHFPLAYERTCVTRQENSTGADGESLLTAWPSHIWWDDKDNTQCIIHVLYAIETSCLYYLNGHYQYRLSYPWPCWDPSIILQGLMSQSPFCGHSAVPEINLRGVGIGQTKKFKSQKHKLTAFSTLCRSVGRFVIWHTFSGRYLPWWIWWENCPFDNHVPLTSSQCTLDGPVYTGMPLECHWLTQCTQGYHWATQRILAGYTGTPLEKNCWHIEAEWRIYASKSNQHRIR